MPEKNDLPLVSIAIITYNQKEYLRECIESCLTQDYPNFEIVVADDCSTDGTQDMLREYEAKYPSKFVLRLAEKKQGITVNSNVCLNACSGEFIAFLGGDDVLYQGKISSQVAVFQKYKDVVICGTYTNLINEKSEVIGKVKDYKKKKFPFYSQYELIESNNSLVPVVSYMIRQSAVPSEGFDYRLPVASDSLFYFRVAEHGKIYIIKEFLTGYRLHNSHARRIGYLDDSFVSLALTEFYYPHCFSAVQKARSKIHYAIGRSYAKNGEYYKARIEYKNSLKISFSIKIFIALLLAVIKIKR